MTLYKIGKYGSWGWGVVCVRALKSEVNEFMDRQEIMWKQRPRMNWLREGDHNTIIFTLKLVKEGRGIWLWVHLVRDF